MNMKGKICCVEKCCLAALYYRLAGPIFKERKDKQKTVSLNN